MLVGKQVAQRFTLAASPSRSQQDAGRQANLTLEDLQPLTSRLSSVEAQLDLLLLQLQEDPNEEHLSVQSRGMQAR